jgi:DNA-binding helix-hairpin-helix protein with protein kinase domain
MVVYDSNRRPVRLDTELARGGEALVYRVHGQPALVAKVYTKAHPGYEHKLQWMRGNPPADPNRALGHPSIAWPEDLLRDVNGRLVGFTMPFVPGAVPALDVLSPRRRAQVLPAFDRRYLHRTARNLALAVHALHSGDYVIGDLNQSNVLVMPSALVTVIDTDSFQVREPRPAQIVIYPCPVGKPDYTPPELQGQPFAGMVRLPEHDLFALAVLLFQLLMEGSHPFRGAWLPPGDPPTLEEKIVRGLYPYAVPQPREVAPPPDAAGLDALHPPLADLFDQCFRAGHGSPRLRPAAEAWARALAEAEAALVTCRNGHVHADHLRACPTCGSKNPRVVTRSGRPLAATARTVPARTAVARAPGTAVARRPPIGPRLAALALAPWRATARAVDDAVAGTALALRRGARALGLYAVQRLFVRAGMLPGGQAGLVPPRTARVVRWTVGLALVAAALAAGAALVVGGAWALAGVAPLVVRGVHYGGLAAVTGGLALVLVAWFRAMGEALDGGLTGGEVRQAAGRAMAAGVGWSLAWLLPGLALALLPGLALPATVVGVVGVAGRVDVAAWLVAWLLFGAAGGALGAPAQAPRGRWLFAGGVFGVLGWLVTQAVGLLG